MSTSLPIKVYTNCSSNFLKPLIDTIKAKYIIAVGSKAHEYILTANDYKQKDIIKISDTYGDRPIELVGKQLLFPVFHCGSLRQDNRKISFQIEDWKNIKEFIVKNENKNAIETNKVKLINKITIKDLPFHKNWPQVQDFSFSFSLKLFNYTNS